MTHIKSLEKVQNSFLRTCAWKLGYTREEYTYQNIRDILNLSTLESRRLHTDLIYVFRLFNGYISCSELLALFSLNCPTRQMRSNPTFHTKLHRTNYGFFSPIARLTREVNAHDVEIFGPSLRQFKSSIENLVI